jgi:hypothetical protein
MFETDEVLPPDPVIEFYKKRIDRAVIRENLKLTVEERLDRLMELQALAEEWRKAGRAEDEMPQLTLADLKASDSRPANVRHQPPTPRR